MNQRTRTTRPARAVGVTFAVLLASCSSDSTDSSRDVNQPASADASASTTTTGSDNDLPEGAEALVGRFAHFDAVSYEDDTMKTVIISTGYADFDIRDGQIWNQMTFCHADTATDQSIEVGLSDAATRAIKPVATPVELSRVDGKLHVSRPATPTGIGITFDDPASDILPTDPTDPRIIDADGDGKPGVTSTIKLGEDFEAEIYLARREIFAYEVTQESPDRFVGSITDDSEQLILGATDPLFETPTEWVQLEDPARNPVIWQRVDAGTDCDAIAQQRAELFPPNPAADW